MIVTRLSVLFVLANRYWKIRKRRYSIKNHTSLNFYACNIRNIVKRTTHQSVMEVQSCPSHIGCGTDAVRVAEA
jgi:hypothetical protein